MPQNSKANNKVNKRKMYDAFVDIYYTCETFPRRYVYETSRSHELPIFGSFLLSLNAHASSFLFSHLVKLQDDVNSYSFICRNHVRTALLPAMEQLPEQHDFRVSPTTAERSFCGRNVSMQ